MTAKVSADELVSSGVIDEPLARGGFVKGGVAWVEDCGVPITPAMRELLKFKTIIITITPIKMIDFKV
jgi:hypothetical protein